MNYNRRGDPRVYIVTATFFASVISGGVLLSLYLLLPVSRIIFLRAGMVLVGIPWVFWFIGYLYTCLIKPCLIKKSSPRSAFHVSSEKEEVNGTAYGVVAAPPQEPQAPGDASGGGRHVQFGSVTVIGSRNDNSVGGSSNGNNQDGNGLPGDPNRDYPEVDVERGPQGGCNGEVDANRDESSCSSKESEKPLRFSAAAQ